MKPADGYIAYIVNPKSGASSCKLTEQLFRKYLSEKGFESRVSYTASLPHACELAAAAAEDNRCAMVAVAGGDGTVREVAHGLASSNKPLLIIPCGTENLLANELGFDAKPQTVINVFEAGYTKDLDLGSANGRCFTSIAGFGFDGKVVERVSKERKGHIDYTDYFWPIWRTFWDYKFDKMQVTVDGREIFNDHGMVFVGNISKYAMGLGILKQADYSDGLLDVCIYKCTSRIRLIKHSLMTMLKQHIRSKDVIYCQGRKIIVSSDNNDVRTQMDGDPGPNLPVEIEVIPKAVKIMVPKDAKPAGIRTRIIRALG
jgi:YegS/Rv2252/BmrU family lipid kinase